MQIAHYRDQLLQLRQKYAALLERTADVKGDFFTWRQIKRWNKLIRAVDRALWRIDHGLFGFCERCQQKISPKRLVDLPHAALCLSCQRQKEKDRLTPE